MKEIKLIENKISMKGVRDWVFKITVHHLPAVAAKLAHAVIQQDKKVWVKRL